jgi:hypothetical protein
MIRKIIEFASVLLVLVYVVYADILLIGESIRLFNMPDTNSVFVGVLLSIGAIVSSLIGASVITYAVKSFKVKS